MLPSLQLTFAEGNTRYALRCYNNTVVITLVGENEYAIAEELRALVGRFAAKFGAHGVERINGELYDPTGLAQLLQGASLFAPQRLVVMKDAAANKPLWEALGEWAEKVPAETTLVVVEPAADKRTRTYKVLKAKSQFKEFSQPSEAELAAWSIAKSKDLGATLGKAEAQYLVERAGRDQWRLNQEVEKLASYQPQITREAITTLVEPSPEGTAFELLDAALAGNSQRVTTLINNLRTEEDPYKLFGLLASQVHTLAVVSLAGSRSPDEIAKDAGLHPFVVRKTVGAARRLGGANIRQIADDVALCDYQLKSTGADPWQLIAMCLQKMATI
jgi:DNA polymerase III subunit delta